MPSDDTGLMFLTVICRPSFVSICITEVELIRSNRCRKHLPLVVMGGQLGRNAHFVCLIPPPCVSAVFHCPAPHLLSEELVHFRRITFDAVSVCPSKFALHNDLDWT
jgi:hypothetical protein